MSGASANIVGATRGEVVNATMFALVWRERIPRKTETDYEKPRSGCLRKGIYLFGSGDQRLNKNLIERRIKKSASHYILVRAMT